MKTFIIILCLFAIGLNATILFENFVKSHHQPEGLVFIDNLACVPQAYTQTCYTRYSTWYGYEIVPYFTVDKDGVRYPK